MGMQQIVLPQVTLSLLRLHNPQIAAAFAGKEFIDFCVARNGRAEVF
jgi:hypothetical protein